MAQTTINITTKRTWQFRVTMFLLNVRLNKLALTLFEGSKMMNVTCGSKTTDVYLSEFWDEVKKV